LFLLLLFSISCTNSEESDDIIIVQKNYKYLALGDSYTIGQSVCETCRFPIQLQDSITKYINDVDTFQTKIIAQTGWTTTNLKSVIATQNPSNDYDLVTLLIGVNNQYQNQPFSVYQQEFPELVSIAIQKAKGNKNNVIVVSIPDYAYTPFGNGNTTITSQIDAYNTFAENYCLANNITFVYITDITRMGLVQNNLVASDGLHPSTLAYTKFVERILPKVLLKINN
jgi:acyl-CoA thioesterase I